MFEVRVEGGGRNCLFETHVWSHDGFLRGKLVLYHVQRYTHAHVLQQSTAVEFSSGLSFSPQVLYLLYTHI